MKTWYEQIYGTDKYKYLGEVIERNVPEKEAIKAHVKKVAYHLIKYTYCLLYTSRCV